MTNKVKETDNIKNCIDAEAPSTCIVSIEKICRRKCTSCGYDAVVFHPILKCVACSTEYTTDELLPKCPECGNNDYDTVCPECHADSDLLYYYSEYLPMVADGTIEEC